MLVSFYKTIDFYEQWPVRSALAERIDEMNSHGGIITRHSAKTRPKLLPWYKSQKLYRYSCHTERK